MKKALALNLGLLSLLCLFLLILSVLGFRVVISQSLGHHNYIINVLMILECWGKTGFFKNTKKPFFLKRSCRKFYEATIAFFFTLFVFFAFYAIKGKVPDTITFIQGIFFIVVFSFIYFFIEHVLYKYKWSRYSMGRRLLIEAIRKGEKKFYRPDWDLQLEDEGSDLWKEINDIPGSEKLQPLKESKPL